MGRTRLIGCDVTITDAEKDEDLLDKAVAFDGEPSTGSDTQVVRRDDRWWISVGP